MGEDATTFKFTHETTYGGQPCRYEVVEITTEYYIEQGGDRIVGRRIYRGFNEIDPREPAVFMAMNDTNCWVFFDDLKDPVGEVMLKGSHDDTIKFILDNPGHYNE